MSASDSYVSSTSSTTWLSLLAAAAVGAGIATVTSFVLVSRLSGPPRSKRDRHAHGFQEETPVQHSRQQQQQHQRHGKKVTPPSALATSSHPHLRSNASSHASSPSGVLLRPGLGGPSAPAVTNGHGNAAYNHNDPLSSLLAAGPSRLSTSFDAGGSLAAHMAKKNEESATLQISMTAATASGLLSPEADDEDDLADEEEILNDTEVDDEEDEEERGARIEGERMAGGEQGQALSADAREGGSMKRAVSLTNLQDSLHLGATNPIAADFLRKAPEQETFVRLNVAPLDEPSSEDREVCAMMQECLSLRQKYVFREALPPWRRDPATLPMPDPNDPFRYHAAPPTEHVCRMVDGVTRVFANEAAAARGEELFPVHDATTFFTDLHRVLKITSLGHVRSLCFHRLKLLEQRFHLHLLLNADREFRGQKSAPHRDLYNVRKVDTHVHHSACMNQKHLLRFIKSKLRKEPDEVVIFRDGKYLTLKEVFESLELTGYDLNVDLLDVHADKNTFHRFDRFNLKYNPCGQSRLREIFIKQDNLLQGRFLAEVTKEVFTDMEASKYQMAEYRISIYGRKKSEWDQLASWIVNNQLFCKNVVWLIQLPRLYNVYKDMGIVTSFQTLLDNVFEPLFEVSVDPSSHPHLHIMLNQVVGFDMVDDESKPERRPTKHMITPAQWVNPFNPAYAYYTYYVYANLVTLNKLRESKGLSIIKFRPHSGEAGDIDHLAATFLTAHNIAHGNNLRRSPALQYLYYLAQIGLAMSPLSNNSLFLDYQKNPFPLFFARGLNVSLSTDDPLMIHLTKEPLVEEYSIAAQVWRLTSCDLCEIARNSVYQSGFWHPVKAHWVGPHYYLQGPDGNDIHCTNVPHIRVEFRHEVLKAEMEYVYLGHAVLPTEIEA